MDYKRERMFFIEEKILLKDIPKGAKDLRIWIPCAVNDEWQLISDFKLISPFDADIITDKKYGNKFLYLKPKERPLKVREKEIILSFKAQRREYNGSYDLTNSHRALIYFLKPNRLVPVNSQMRKLAEKITEGKSSELDEVRAIYDYIIDELTYSKDDPKVCGIGDSLLTLRYKKGICTDYHSLFISLVRSLGIPAKFEIGIPIPLDKEEGRITSYHCWAKFYLKDMGWVPVDISEADKHPEKREYFFGNIDENRLLFTAGRDINLKYARDSQPLNFIVYPYAELDGVKFVNMDVELSFKDLKGGVLR